MQIFAKWGLSYIYTNSELVEMENPWQMKNLETFLTLQLDSNPEPLSS